jgi:hypothetical protein
MAARAAEGNAVTTSDLAALALPYTTICWQLGYELRHNENLTDYVNRRRHCIAEPADPKLCSTRCSLEAAWNRQNLVHDDHLMLFGSSVEAVAQSRRQAP